MSLPLDSVNRAGWCVFIPSHEYTYNFHLSSIYPSIIYHLSIHPLSIYLPIYHLSIHLLPIYLKLWVPWYCPFQSNNPEFILTPFFKSPPVTLLFPWVALFTLSGSDTLALVLCVLLPHTLPTADVHLALMNHYWFRTEFFTGGREAKEEHVPSLTHHSYIHACMHPLVYPAMHILIHPWIHASILLFIHPAVHPSVHSLVPSTHPPVCPSIPDCTRAGACGCTTYISKPHSRTQAVMMGVWTQLEEGYGDEPEAERVLFWCWTWEPKVNCDSA